MELSTCGSTRSIRPKLAQTFARLGAELGTALICFRCSVNTGERGHRRQAILPADADALSRECQSLDALPVRGLMCIRRSTRKPRFIVACWPRLRRGKRGRRLVDGEQRLEKAIAAWMRPMCASLCLFGTQRAAKGCLLDELNGYGRVSRVRYYDCSCGAEKRRSLRWGKSGRRCWWIRSQIHAPARHWPVQSVRITSH